MTIAHDTELDRDRVPTATVAMTTSEVLEKAHAMAKQIERLLMSPSCHMPSSDTFRIRLARAHALSLLDQLSELVSRRPSDRPSDDGARMARCRPGEDADTTVSGVHPASSLR
jgi:hypothetical protein